MDKQTADLPCLSFEYVRQERGESFEEALGLAVAAHIRQRDLVGEQYIWHPMRVALAARRHGNEYAIVGILHDVIEDCPDMACVVFESFTQRICDALTAISRREGEAYEAYLKRVEGNEIARVVKIEDVRDNMLRSSNLPATPANRARLAKYSQALVSLGGVG